MQDLAFGSDVTDTGRIDLSLSMLPTYALFSVVRMFVALLFSLFVTFVFGTLAARSVVAERFIIPMVDVLQSIPILGYLTIAATVFEKVFMAVCLGTKWLLYL